MHLRKITVRGRGEFPLDMLRYDSCWPSTGQDVEKIRPLYTMVDREGLGPREVGLSKYVRLKSDPVFEERRWRSFGWEVIKRSY